MATPEILNTDTVSVTAQEIKNRKLAAVGYGVFTGIALADLSLGVMGLTNPALRAHADATTVMMILTGLGAVGTPLLGRRTLSLLKS